MRWQTFITRAPLPMLALTAAYGVYRFQALFVPAVFALVGAAAFELTYVALAVVGTQDTARGVWVARAAVAVSILYNTLSGLFDRRPELLMQTNLGMDVALAVLHGLPLALIAYNMSVLFLHARGARPTHPEPQEVAPLARSPLTVREFVAMRARAMLEDDQALRLTDLAVRLGTSPDTVRRALADMAAAERAALDARATDTEIDAA